MLLIKKRNRTKIKISNMKSQSLDLKKARSRFFFFNGPMSPILESMERVENRRYEIAVE